MCSNTFFLLLQDHSKFKGVFVGKRVNLYNNAHSQSLQCRSAKDSVRISVC